MFIWDVNFRCEITSEEICIETKPGLCGILHQCIINGERHWFRDETEWTKENHRSLKTLMIIFSKKILIVMATFHKTHFIRRTSQKKHTKIISDKSQNKRSSPLRVITMSHIFKNAVYLLHFKYRWVLQEEHGSLLIVHTTEAIVFNYEKSLALFQ